MANDGRHAKPKSGVFSQPAQQPTPERKPYDKTAVPSGGYTEYQPRRESSATRYTQRPDPAQTRQPNRYTERVVRQTPPASQRPVYTERPAERRGYTQRPDYPYESYTQRSVARTTVTERPVDRPSPYQERVAAQKARAVQTQTTPPRPASRPAERPPRRSEGVSQPVPPRAKAPAAKAKPRPSAYKPRKRMDGGLLLACVLLLALILFVLANLFGNVGDKSKEKPADTPVVQTTPTPEVTPAPTEIPTATPVPTPEGDPAKLVDGRVVPADWGVVVPQRDVAQFNSFFDNSVMIGNSLAEGFYMWAGLAENFTFICNANLWIDQVIGGIDLSKVTLNPGMYESIYLVFGLNEVGNSVELFIEEYVELIDFLREYQPNATIYVHSVTPVMEKVDKDPGEVQTMARIDNFNERLKEMCAEKECWYVDIYSMLIDENGYLSTAYAFEGDGKHFEKSGYVAWADYLKSHYVDESLVPQS